MTAAQLATAAGRAAAPAKVPVPVPVPVPVRAPIALHNPVHLLLVALALIAGATLPLLTYAPNRLLAGQGILLADLSARPWLPLLPALALLTAPWLRPSRARRIGVIVAAAAFGAALLALAGQEARLRGADADGLARVSFGGAFWLLILFAWLQLGEALRGLALPLPGRIATLLATSLPLAALLASDRLDQLSLLKEYHNHRDSFDLALLRHLQLVLWSVLPAVPIGAALGALTFRVRAARALVFPVLNVMQTLPSMALFGLLIGPLALLGRLWPESGIGGVGLAPALLALTLYALLPMTRGTLAGLEQVPAGAREAARGIGMSAGQVFWRVELPLALPIFLGAIRVTAVQAVGLAEVAALIGAGGFGAIMFQGMASSALDLVLLGVLPVLLLAAGVDTAFKLAISFLTSRIGTGHDRD